MASTVAAPTSSLDGLAGDFRDMMSLGSQAAVAKASESERLFSGSAASKVVEEGVMGGACPARPAEMPSAATRVVVIEETPQRAPVSKATLEDRNANSGPTSGVVKVGGVEHAWRVTPEGLELVPRVPPEAPENFFTSRAPSPFRPVGLNPVTAQQAAPRALRSRSSSPTRRKVASPEVVGSAKGPRALDATPVKERVASPAAPQYYPSRTSVVTKPTIVYPIFSVGTEIRPPPLPIVPPRPYEAGMPTVPGASGTWQTLSWGLAGAAPPPNLPRQFTQVGQGYGLGFARGLEGLPGLGVWREPRGAN